MAKDFSKMSSDIMKYIGGVDNVIDIAHLCNQIKISFEKF